MKVLLYDTTLSFITPGGKTTHAIKLHQELKKIGVDIEFAQWWNKEQSDFDIIHTLAHQIEPIVDFSHKKGKKVILTQIMDIESNKPLRKQYKEIFFSKIQAFFPFTMEKIQGIRAIPKFDHVVYMNESDRKTALRYYNKLNINKTSIIPHAFDPVDMYIGEDIKINNIPEKYILSCANIDWRKQSHLLARFARKAKVPIVFIGNSNKEDEYYKLFIKEIDNKYTFYLGFVDLKTKDSLERKAAGFALLSLAESGCIAVYEAAAYKLPLFLSNLPWAKHYDSATNISYCDFKNESKAINELSLFFHLKAGLKESTPFEVKTWNEIAHMYKDLYKTIYNNNSVLYL